MVLWQVPFAIFFPQISLEDTVGLIYVFQALHYLIADEDIEELEIGLD
jgi:hypothetical protein